MICLPEVPFNVEHFVEKVRVMQEKKPSIVIAVSEGVKLEDGRYVCELADDVHAVDAFGHKALTGTARYLANVVARNLDTKTRCIELSTLQRCAGHRPAAPTSPRPIRSAVLLPRLRLRASPARWWP